MQFLLTLILLGISSTTFANSYIGGWVGATTIQGDGKYYLLDETYTDIGAYATYSINDTFSISGQGFYDPVYDSLRFGYFYGQAQTSINDYVMRVQVGRLRSDLGLWSDYMIDPSIRPTVLNLMASYPVRFESDVALHDGISIDIHRGKWKLEFLYGSNSPYDTETFSMNTSNQISPVNTDLGSLATISLEYKPYMNHTIRTSYNYANPIPKISNRVDQYYIGYKYVNRKWLATIEYQRVSTIANVYFGSPFIPDTTSDIDIDEYNLYLSYQYKKCKIYGYFSKIDKNQDYTNYILSSSLKNILLAGGTPTLFDPALANPYQSEAVGFGLSFSLPKDIHLRGEIAYVKNNGVSRKENIVSSLTRPEDTTYIGISVIKSF